MKWLIILIILSFAVFYACTPTKKTNETASSTNTTTRTTTTTKPAVTPTIAEQLEGQWLMHKYVCCGRKKVVQMGRGIKKPQGLVFASNNQVTITNLRTRESKTITYQLETKKEVSNPPITYIIFGENKSKGIVRFEGTELVLDYQYMDLQQEFYRKATGNK